MEGFLRSFLFNSFFILVSWLCISPAQAHPIQQLGQYSSKPVLADILLLRQAGVPILYSEPGSSVGYAAMTPEQELRLSVLAHRLGKCAGFESLEGEVRSLNDAKQSLTQVARLSERANFYSQMRIRDFRFSANPEILQAVSELSAPNLRKWVEWMSKFPSRYNRASDPNVHVRALLEQLKTLGFRSKYPLRVDLIDHSSTKQKSVRIHIEGTQRPNEIVVLGAHFDSINMGGGPAPGSDDNASGSANLLEALRVLITKPAPARSVEFFWYAGEESGLLGSAEIAKAYRAQKANVVGVLQLDMTLFPGAGSGKIGMMTDYTSPWLRDFFSGLNSAYVGAKFVESTCGYGCSDHASWFRQGYPTVIPFEATMDTMNRNLHTARDVIDNRSNFEHSLMFSKLALSYVMELANSTQTQPF